MKKFRKKVKKRNNKNKRKNKIIKMKKIQN